MEKIFLEFLNIYFWVFLCLSILDILNIKTELKDFRDNKKNAIKNGTYSNKGGGAIILITLFILSIILT